MPPYRRFRRAVYARRKRNSERIIRAGSSTIAAASQIAAITYTAVEACTVKSIKLDTGAATLANDSVIPYCLVRVEEGYNPNQITYPALSDDMYNPTAEVLISGILTDNTVEDHKYNMIGRKMKKGDRLVLIYLNTNATVSALVSFELNFSVLT